MLNMKSLMLIYWLHLEALIRLTMVKIKPRIMAHKYKLLGENKSLVMCFHHRKVEWELLFQAVDYSSLIAIVNRAWTLL